MRDISHNPWFVFAGNAVGVAIAASVPSPAFCRHLAPTCRLPWYENHIHLRRRPSPRGNQPLRPHGQRHLDYHDRAEHHGSWSGNPGRHPRWWLSEPEPRAWRQRRFSSRLRPFALGWDDLLPDDPCHLSRPSPARSQPCGLIRHDRAGCSRIDHPCGGLPEVLNLHLNPAVSLRKIKKRIRSRSRSEIGEPSFRW